MVCYFGVERSKKSTGTVRTERVNILQQILSKQASIFRFAMAKSILFALPQHFVSVLLVEWVGVKAIPRLDSACCAAVERSVLLEVLRSQQNVFITKKTSKIINSQCLRWFELRSLKVSSVFIRCSKDPFDTRSFEKYLSLCGRHLNELSITMDCSNTVKLSTLLQYAVLYTPDLGSLCIKTHDLSNYVRDLICQFTKLRKLTIMAEQLVHNSQDADPFSPETTLCKAADVKPLLMLQSLALSIKWGVYAQNQAFFLSLLQLSPSLKSLTLSYTLGLQYSKLTEVCPNLQSLTLIDTEIKARDLIEISEKNSNIAELTLKHLFCDDDIFALSTVFCNLRLRTLSIDYVNDIVISSIGTFLHDTLHTFSMPCALGSRVEMSVYWDVFTKCRLLHTLMISEVELVGMCDYRNNAGYEDRTLEHITTLYLEAWDDCKAPSCISVLFPRIQTLHVIWVSDQQTNELINTVVLCSQLRTLYVDAVSDSVHRTMRKVNPRLQIYTSTNA